MTAPTGQKKKPPAQTAGRPRLTPERVIDGAVELADEIGFKEARPRYAGRMSAASPATGSASRHAVEQAELIDEALTLGRKRMGRVAARKAKYQASSAKSRKAAE